MPLSTRHHGKRLSLWINATLGLLLVLVSVAVVALVNQQMREQALAEAGAKARILLDHNLAIHTYFTHQLKPPLFEKLDPLVGKGYFEPTWMSSTYAVREIDQYFHALNGEDYYYKEGAIHARSPDNEADAFERQFLEELNQDPQLVDYSGVRMLDGKPYFFTMRRGEVMEEACLRCHDTPDRAPADLVRLYGAERSFHRTEGEVVSVLSRRVPLAEAYAEADRLSWNLSLILLATLVLLFAAHYWISRRLLFAPLDRLRAKALAIAASETHLGEQIELPAGRELAELTAAFNAMSGKLHVDRQHLEQHVAERTAELSDLNAQLQQEIGEREQAETQLKAANRELERISMQDGLLGIANRRHLDEVLAKEYSRALRQRAPLSLIIADIDQFKDYNDHYGHQAGDDSLRKVAQAMAARLKRPTDLLARYGGEEIAVVLPDTAADGAREIAERLRAAVEQVAIPHAASAVAPHVTISLGVHTLQPSEVVQEEGLAAFIGTADGALYAAKRAGRNRVVAA
ncbi:MAG: diguanylate cyclase [Gammaproteobacteria bacterium]|nr:diguanylate cyclase [Gammaproteobacteria bacterium]